MCSRSWRGTVQRYTFLRSGRVHASSWIDMEDYKPYTETHYTYITRSYLRRFNSFECHSSLRFSPSETRLGQSVSGCDFRLEVITVRLSNAHVATALAVLHGGKLDETQLSRQDVAKRVRQSSGASRYMMLNDVDKEAGDAIKV